MVKKSDGISVAVTGAGENGVFRCEEIENVLNSNLAWTPSITFKFLMMI